MSNRLLLAVWLVHGVAPAVAQQSAPRSAKPAPKAPTSPALVAGRVSLANAMPAAGAQIYLRWTTDSGEPKVSRLTADTKGAFSGSVSFVPKPIQPAIEVTAVLPGQGIVCRMTPLAHNSLGKLDLRLNPATPLTGRLIRADGRPAPNIPLSIAMLTAPASVPSGPDAALETQSQQQEVEIRMRRAGILAQAASQFHSQTDAAGRFTLKGLPRGSFVILKPRGGLLLAYGSMGATEVRAASHQDMGILVAVEPGRIRARVLDRSTNKPAAGVRAQLEPTNALVTAMGLAELDLDNTSEIGNLSAQSDAQGELEFAGLRPGDYRMQIEGRIVKSHVDEGRTAAPILLSLRRGMLRGRLLDAAAKPLAHIAITVLDGTPHSLTTENRFAAGDQDTNQAVKTGADGSFTLSQIPWGGPAVTIRARRGNDLAEWSGSPDKLGPSLTLNMRANALMTISGQLIDPQRRPLTKLIFQTLHWLDSPRSTWFATAHQATSDVQGHFRINGLERGESFSLVTGPKSRPDVETASFESPRFTTASAGQEQDLGDVMVHPIQNPDQILQIYGDSDPIQQARLSGFLPVPRPDDIASARQVLAQYQGALKTGDLDVLHRLCSHVSPGWSADRRGFLEHCSLTTLGQTDPLTSEYVRAIPLAPRTAAAIMLRLRAMAQATTGGIDSNAGIRELDLNPNYIFFAEQGPDAVGLAGVLCKEDGVWRVVAIPGELAAGEAQLLFAGRIGAPRAEDRPDFMRAAPPLESAARSEAEQVALKYLKFWAQNRTASMLTLTAPISPLYTRDIQEHKQRLSQRQDEGTCPATETDTVALQPLDNLTIWDQNFLIAQVSPQQSNNSRSRFPRRSEDLDGPDAANFARRGDTALFRYCAEGQWYLMILVRYDGKWSVLEPALTL